VREWQPDVLHCHLAHAHGVGALLRARGLECPQVWTHHSVDRHRRPMRRLFYRFFARTAACHVYVSDATRRFRSRWGGVAGWEEVIHNGVDLAPLLAVRPAAGPVFGAVGRLVPEKGYDALIRAFGRFAKEQPDARLVIAGAGPEQAALERLIQEEGLASRASLAGFVHDVPGFLAGLNAFLAPSHWESFGLMLLEALAAGLPCAASRVDGMVEVGGDLVHWVEPGDVAGLCDAMRRLWRLPLDPERIERQRRWASRFSREAMTDRYLDVYRALCERQGARSPNMRE
jgi:glycosyltransferase involved in cell wall biosynthesis